MGDIFADKANMKARYTVFENVEYKIEKYNLLNYEWNRLEVFEQWVTSSSSHLIIKNLFLDLEMSWQMLAN